MSLKSNGRQLAALFSPVSFIAVALIFFHVDIYAMYGNIGDLRGALGRRAAGQGIKSNEPSSSPRAATLSPQAISSFAQAIKKLDVNAVKNLVNENSGLLTDPRAKAIKSAVEAPSNDSSRGNHLELFRFLLGQINDPNVTENPFAMNALDIVAGKIKSSQDSQDQEAVDFYQTIARELVAKGAILKKRQDHQFIIDQLKPRFSTPEIISPKEPEIITPSVAQSSDASPDKLTHPTLARPMRTKNHPLRGIRPSSATTLSGDVDASGSPLAQETVPAMLPSDAIVPLENPIPSVESIVKEEVAPALPLQSMSLDSSSSGAPQSVSPDNLPAVFEPVDFGTQEPLPLPSLPDSVTVHPSPVQEEASLPSVPDSVPLPPVAGFESVSSGLELPSMAAIEEPLSLMPVQDSLSLPPASEAVTLPPVAEFESPSNIAEPVDFAVSLYSPSDAGSVLSDQESLPLPPPAFTSEIPHEQKLPMINNFNGNFYEILGLPSNASTADIKKAYYKLSLKYHPDKNPGNEAEAKEFFQKIQEAHGILGDSEKRAEYDVSQGIAQSEESFGPDYKMADLRNAVRNLDYAQSVEILGKSSLLFEPAAEALKVLLKLVTPKDEASKAILLDIFQYALAQKDIDVNLRPVFEDRPETVLDVAFDRLEKHFSEGDVYAVSFFEQAIKLLDAQGATLMRFASDERAQQVVQELRSRPAYSVQQLEEFFQERKISQWKEFKAHKSQVAERAELQKIREGLARDLRSLSNDLTQEREALDLLEHKRQDLISVRENTQREIKNMRQLIESLRTNVRTNE